VKDKGRIGQERAWPGGPSQLAPSGREARGEVINCIFCPAPGPGQRSPRKGRPPRGELQLSARAVPQHGQGASREGGPRVARPLTIANWGPGQRPGHAQLIKSRASGSVSAQRGRAVPRVAST